MSPSAQLTTAPQVKELPQHDQPADENASAKMSNANITASSPKKPMSAAERSATKKSLFILAGIFVTSLAAMFYVYMIFPELNE